MKTFCSAPANVRLSLLGAFLIPASLAVADVHPYADIIVTRNVFDLKEPPPPPLPPDTTPPAPTIKLVGIANVLGQRKVVLKPQPAPGAPPKPGTPGQPPPGQEPPLVISEGDMREGISVESIDEVSGIVKLNNNGIALTLTLDKDGPKAPSGPAAPVPGTPGQPVPGQPGIPRPPGMPGMVTTGGANTLPPGIAPTTPGGIAAAGGGVPTAVANQTSVPQRPLRSQNDALTLEQRMVMMEIERERTREAVQSGRMPPIPPTPLTSQQDFDAIARRAQPLPPPK
jgi:hypothetical protein